MKRKLVYLASPYSHKDPNIMNERFEIVQEVAVNMLSQNIYAFSPIAYNHPMLKFNLPGNWEFWEEYDKAFLDHSDLVVVLMIDGWDISVGVQAEIEYAGEIGIPVIYLSIENANSNHFDNILSALKL